MLTTRWVACCSGHVRGQDTPSPISLLLRPTPWRRRPSSPAGSTAPSPSYASPGTADAGSSASLNRRRSPTCRNYNQPPHQLLHTDGLLLPPLTDYSDTRHVIITNNKKLIQSRQRRPASSHSTDRSVVFARWRPWDLWSTKVWPQMACRSVQLFLQGSRHTATDTPTDHATCDVCSNSPHLALSKYTAVCNPFQNTWTR